MNRDEPDTAGGSFGVILPAAGGGSRFGGDKLACVVAGRTVLEHSVAAFIDRLEVSAVVVVRDPAGPLSEELLNHPRLHTCAGGATRAASVRAGLDLLRALPEPPEMVAVHDAARPAVASELIDRVFAEARRHGAAVPGVPLSDTIKQVANGRVERTLPRGSLLAAQTPQAMRLGWLVESYARCPVSLEEITDDAQLLELAGFPVHVVEGQELNLKITRRADLETVEGLLARREDQSGK